MPLAGHTSLVMSVAFSPDGKTLATGSRSQTVLFWDLDLDGIRFARATPHPERPGWVNVARRMANRELTNEEVREHFGDLAKLYEPLWKDNDVRKP
jgi:WD40 repeat protein